MNKLLSVQLSLTSLKIWDNRNINTRNNGRSDNPGNIRSQGISQDKRVRIIFAHQLLSHFSRSGYTTDGGIMGGYIMYFIKKGNYNPVIGIAAVSCVPTTAKVAQKLVSKDNPDYNFPS